MTSDTTPGTLSIEALRKQLSRQHEERRKLQDQRSAVHAGLSALEGEIHSTRKQIAELSDATPVQVSDHAVIRYLQRICGVDIQAVADALDKPALRNFIKENPTGRCVIDETIYVVKDRLLVTVIYEDRAPGIERIPMMADRFEEAV